MVQLKFLRLRLKLIAAFQRMRHSDAQRQHDRSLPFQTLDDFSHPAAHRPRIADALLFSNFK